MNFEWEDRNGYHEVTLYDKGEELANMCFWDFTNPNQLEFDKSHKYTRAFAFQANFCDNNLQFSSKTYFDGDKKLINTMIKMVKRFMDIKEIPFILPMKLKDGARNIFLRYINHQNDGKIGIKNHQNDG